MARSDRFVDRRNRSGATHLSKTFNTNFRIIFIIFVLIGVAVVARLFWLQLIRHSYYLAKARDQHEFNVQLAPTRGQIFVHNNSAITGDDLYPIATNRRFFTLYAIPRSLQSEVIGELRQQQSEQTNLNNNKIAPIILEPQELAEVLFESFDQPLILANIDKIENDRLKEQLDSQLKQLPTASSTDELAVAKEDILNRQAALLNDPFYQEMAKARREAAIKEQSESKINEYLNILNKGDDPYEVVAKKLESDQILKVYFKILSR
ncbi:hypothetical protein EOM71_02755, partial [Candidatus Falkowbacteria bacterium]|nr:hypothetical protein [Candidatus Falkowbacteria bacterium]